MRRASLCIYDLDIHLATDDEKPSLSQSIHPSQNLAARLYRIHIAHQPENDPLQGTKVVVLGGYDLLQQLQIQRLQHIEVCPEQNERDLFDVGGCYVGEQGGHPCVLVRGALGEKKAVEGEGAQACV